MTTCYPTNKYLREPMADPSESRSSDAARDTDTDLVEYLVVAVPDLGSLRTVTRALANVVVSEAIRILDLVCVSRSAEGGGLTVVEFEEIEEMAALEKVDGDVGGLLSTRDIETASRSVAAGSSALLLVVEDRWARGLSTSARQAAGRVLGGERVSRPLVEAALEATYRSTGADKRLGDGVNMRRVARSRREHPDLLRSSPSETILSGGGVFPCAPTRHDRVMSGPKRKGSQ
jgi:hypothetical protein